MSDRMAQVFKAMGFRNRPGMSRRRMLAGRLAVARTVAKVEGDGETLEAIERAEAAMKAGRFDDAERFINRWVASRRAGAREARSR